MLKRVITGMKHTNKYIYAFLLIAAFSNPIKADDSLSPNIKAIVKNSYDQDIKKFKKCVSEEGLIASEQIHTNCTIVRLERACKILNQFKECDVTLFLEGFSPPKRLTRPNINYPKSSQRKGLTGFAVVSFDIDESGKTTNHQIVPPLSHKSFQAEALKAARQLEYSPLLFNGVPVPFNKMKHKFTFVLESENIVLDAGARSYNKILRLLKAGKFTEAETLALKKLNKDPFFYYQLSLARFGQKNFEGAANAAQDFFNHQDSKELHMPEYYFLAHATRVYAESLYRSNQIEELIGIETMLKRLSPGKRYKNDIVWTMIYLGTALISKNKTLDGIYFLILAKNSAIKENNESAVNVIDSILENLEDALS